MTHSTDSSSDQPVDELRRKIQDAVCPPSEHPTLGTMRLAGEPGIYSTGEFRITGDFSNAVNRLEELIQAECNRARADELKRMANIIGLRLHTDLNLSRRKIKEALIEREAELQQLMKGGE